MNKAEAIEIIDDYEADFEEIESVIDNAELTATEKISEIQDIIKEEENGTDEEN